LAKVAPRKEKEVDQPEWYTQTVPILRAKDANAIVQSGVVTISTSRRTYETSTDFNLWTSYAHIGVNDFYGIAMLALAYEGNGEHFRAMFHLHRAHKIEPRVINPSWMTAHFNWEEKHHKLIERIVADPIFWDLPYQLSDTGSIMSHQ
jgi:hypothetical protein